MDSSALTSPKRWQPHTRRASGYPSAVSARQPAPAAAAETPLERPWRAHSEDAVDAGQQRCGLRLAVAGVEDDQLDRGTGRVERIFERAGRDKLGPTIGALKE